MKDALGGIKKSWGSRLLSTSKVAASAARLGARRVVGAAGPRDGLIAERLAHELEQMKGMAMKLGQVVSYFDGILPDEAHQALRILQVGSEPVEFSVIAGVIEESFGTPVSGLFDDLEEQPIAAASIGQVHRARFRGAPVAVKVQYPGIRSTISSDFASLRQLSRLASLATSVDGPALVAELEQRFTEECDYELEARRQTAFKNAFAGRPGTRVPGAIPERTRDRVLTSEWCPGSGFYDFLERGKPSEHNRVALTLTRFGLQSLYEFGCLNADPHPGNYLVEADGTVTFLDFGCVRVFEREFLARHRHLVAVVIDDRYGDFRDAVLDTGTVGNSKRFDFDYHWRMLRHAYAPFSSREFEFTSDFVRQGLEMNGARSPNARWLAVQPQAIWIDRMQWGLFAVLAHLRARGEFGEVLRDALSSEPNPLFVSNDD